MSTVSDELKVITLSQSPSILRHLRPAKGILFLETASPNFKSS